MLGLLEVRDAIFVKATWALSSPIVTFSTRVRIQIYRFVDYE